MTSPSPIQEERAREVEANTKLIEQALHWSDKGRMLQPYNVKPLLRRMAKALAFAEQSRATDRIAVVEEAAQHMLDAWDANNQDDMEAALTNIRSALAGQPLTYQTIAEIRALSKEHNHVEG